MSNNYLSKTQIEAKKNQLSKAIKDEAERSKTASRNTAAGTFLMEIKDIVKESFESGVSARQLAKQIHNVYDFKISEQTIKTFAKNVLKIEVKVKETRKQDVD